MIQRYALILLALASFLSAQDLDLELEAAYESYRIGEQATRASERQAAFNEAAERYDLLTQQFSSGELYYNLANCYYQLGEPAWALLYYYKAEKLLPRSEKLQANLRTAREQAGVKGESGNGVWRSFMFLHYSLSPGEKQLLFTGIFLAAVLAWSVYIWRPRGEISMLRWSLVTAALLVASSLVYSNYLASIEAVVVQTSPMRIDAGHHYAIMEGAVLTPGSKVVVSEVLKDGYWVKVRTARGLIGYVPYEVVQII